jgi:hypothetical protein
MAVLNTGWMISPGTNSHPAEVSTQYSVLPWLLCLYLCWGTISTRGYLPHSIHYCHGYCVDTSAGGLLVPGGIIHPVFSTNIHASTEYVVDDTPGC